MFTVSIDLSELKDLFDIGSVASKEAKKAQANIAMATYNHIVEQANQKLHTRRKLYLDSLQIIEDNGDIIIKLDASVNWIEDGMEPRSMLDDLLASPKAKTAKDGEKYLIVPFQHNKPKQQQTRAQQTLLATIKKSLKQVGASPNGIETDTSGNPRLGLVRKLDILSEPVKTMEGPGMGHGPIGDVRQGGSGVPFLQGVNVYQNKVTDKNGKEKVQRTVMTFRVASRKNATDWRHPGLKAMNFFEDAIQWAQKEVDEKIGPALAEQISIQLARR